MVLWGKKHTRIGIWLSICVWSWLYGYAGPLRKWTQQYIQFCLPLWTKTTMALFLFYSFLFFLPPFFFLSPLPSFFLGIAQLCFRYFWLINNWEVKCRGVDVEKVWALVEFMNVRYVKMRLFNLRTIKVYAYQKIYYRKILSFSLKKIIFSH